MLSFKQYILNERLDTNTFIDTTIKKLSKALIEIGDPSSSLNTRIRNAIEKAAHMCIAVDPTIMIEDDRYPDYDINIDIHQFMNFPTGSQQIEYSDKIIKDRASYIRWRNSEFKSGGRYALFASKALINKVNSVIDNTLTNTQWTIKEVLNDVGTRRNIISLLERFVREDIFNVANDIWTFDAVKNNLDQRYRDINKYKNFEGLNRVLVDYEANFKEEIIVEPSDFVIIKGEFDFNEQECSNIFACVYNNHTAARFFGQGTQWCTALDYPKWYNKYTLDGSQIYYMENNGVRYQWHLVTNQLMDEKDHYANNSIFNRTHKLLYISVLDWIDENGSPVDKYMSALFRNKLSMKMGAIKGAELYSTFPDALKYIIATGVETGWKHLISDIIFYTRNESINGMGIIKNIIEALKTNDSSYDNIILHNCADYILGPEGKYFKDSNNNKIEIFKKINRNILYYDSVAIKLISELRPGILEELKQYRKTHFKF